MKKFILILLAVLLLLPVSGECAKKKKRTKKEDKQEKKAEQKKPAKIFKVYFGSGGVYEVDNYTIEGEHIMLMLPSGPIFLDKEMVTRIEKYEGNMDKPSQVIHVKKETRGSDFAPASMEDESAEDAGEATEIVVEKVPAKAEPVEDKPGRVTKPEPPKPAVEVEEPELDDEGHPERWWKTRVSTWDKRQKKAIVEYEEAQRDWNKYDGALATLNAGGNASEYDIQRYQDLRGAARIRMDSAKEEILKAEEMLTETMPEEARTAGAPSWWVDWDGQKYDFK